MMEGYIPTSNRYIYSDRINKRRRSLFPCDNSQSAIDDNSDSDLDHITPLSASDTECGCTSEPDKLGFTNITTIRQLSTPKKKQVSVPEPNMSCSNKSRCEHTSKEHNINNTDIPSMSPTKYLKTPNDSNVLPGFFPKLSRKSLQEMLSEDKIEDDESSTIHSKNSKVRTSLFSDELGVSLSPHQFYPRTNSEKPAQDKHNLLIPISSKSSSQPRRKYKKNLRIFGQINAGVQHSIKKPKLRKPYSTSISSLSKIKTFKTDIILNDELNGYLNDLAELKAERELKLIKHVDTKNAPSSSETSLPTSMKRPCDYEEGHNHKKVKVQENSSSTSNYLQPIETNDDLDLEVPEDISNILNFLNSSLEEDKENENRETSSTNYKDQHFADNLLSPTSEMCNMASVMKINSPKKIKNLNSVFQEMRDNEKQNSSSIHLADDKPNTSQLFPIFYPNHDTGIKRKSFEQYKRKKSKISSNQMLLDAGQKSFGLIMCSECNYFYHAGDPNDEILHENHHNASHILQFFGWKNEHILMDYSNEGRIIQVLPNDSKIWIEKVKRIIEVVNRDMGYFDVDLDVSNSKVLLFIKSKTVIGCLVAENKTKGYKILNSNVGIDLCSTEDYPIQCGISRIWVHPSHRRKGIATKLIDTLKINFISGVSLKNSDIAFTSPTTDGKLFGTKYFQTPNFFTYFD